MYLNWHRSQRSLNKHSTRTNDNEQKMIITDLHRKTDSQFKNEEETTVKITLKKEKKEKERKTLDRTTTKCIGKSIPLVLSNSSMAEI